MSRINEGEVAIILNGEERILKPTLRAITMISSQFGGLAKARDALAVQDFQAAVTVIRWGLNMSDSETKKLPEMVFGSSLGVDLLVPLIRYIGILANGGKPLPDDPVELEDASTEGNA